MDLNFEYIAAHISDYINNENFFDTFDMRDIKIIMKNSHLAADQYVTLLKQSSSTLNSKELYICTRKANVRVQNLEEVVSILNSVKRYMKFNIFDGITDFLKQNEKVINDSTNEREIIQDKSKAFQKENENATKDTTVNVTNENYNQSRDILTKITELKESSDFETVYKFLDELSSTGNHEMISKSIEEGLWKKIAPKIYEYDDHERNVLHFASENGNLRLVQSLIECGCDKESKNNDGWTPLIWASREGHLEVVKYLISVGADKEAKSNNGNTPLILASYHGHLEVVEYLISVGADKEAKNNFGSTPLILASSNGHLEVVKYLISVGADKEAKDNIFGNTPLIWASFKGHLEVVKYLISVGADKEAKNNNGFTPLIIASLNGYLEVVKYLISVGADKEAKNNYGYTPLIYASENGHLEVVKYLISVGADKEAKNKNGKTALDFASGSVKKYFLEDKTK